MEINERSVDPSPGQWSPGTGKIQEPHPYSLNPPLLQWMAFGKATKRLLPNSGHGDRGEISQEFLMATRFASTFHALISWG